jgi:predicted nucleic acid-binding Zn ribbon protein
MKKPQPIRSILEKALKGLEIDLPTKTYSIWGAWEEIVGDAVAAQTQPRAIRNRILFIDVSHSTWIQQLQFLKPTLLEKINAFLGETQIKDIRFKLGKVSATHPAQSKSRGWQEQELDKPTLKQIQDLANRIDDEETRVLLRDILTMGAKLEHHRKTGRH